ncbi:uncharacterized protein LOC131437297 [Malaya genurostris]|uniref:uncharacterized protein LOC131437297 n=1 Tax=Malaya genurostris TaxID=325434 RepID=UPI0026F3BFB9|nr:uncharacterized protein LOC131437297 [Malaya genurostris]
MPKLAVLLGMAFLLLGSVSAQQKENVSEATTTAQEETTTGTNESDGANVLTTIVRNSSLIASIRREIERRLADRLRAIEERRQSILSTLGNLSDRRREYELLRQERKLTAEQERAMRRSENEARRVGRIPSREQKRITQLRQTRVDQTVENDADNEVDGGGASSVADAIRNIVLVEEASGNVRLVDLGTDEGRKLASRVSVREDTAEEKQEVLSKLRLKLGQL